MGCAKKIRRESVLVFLLFVGQFGLTTTKRPIAATVFPMYERPSVVGSAYRWRAKFCSSAVGRPVVSATCTADAANKNTSLVHGARRDEKKPRRRCISKRHGYSLIGDTVQ